MENRRLRSIGLLAAFALACGPGDGPDPSAVSVAVQEVITDRSGHPVILLRETEGGRTLPIWIGLAEARSIASELEHVKPPRPNTHDLAKRLLDGVRARVVRVVVTDLREGTYYGRIVMRGPGGIVDVDSRPSDAIALALRTDAPIFVMDRLFTDEEAEESPPPAPERSGNAGRSI